MTLGDRSIWLASICAAGLELCLLATGPAQAAPVVVCDGVAMVGGAQLLCSHTDPKAPAQLCTYSWGLVTSTNGTQIVDGTFLMLPGAANVTIYQGSGFSSAMSGPSVMCQGKRTSHATGLQSK